MASKNMKSNVLLCIALAMTGCSSFPQVSCPGTSSYDIQVCRGEKAFRVPNFYGEAQQRHDKCLQCIDVDQNCYHMAPPKQCRINAWKGK